MLCSQWNCPSPSRREPIAFSTADKLRLTEQEYLRHARLAESKSEFDHGGTFAIAGASREHDLQVGNLIHSLKNARGDRDSEVYPSDMLVKLTATSHHAYADMVIAWSPVPPVDLGGSQ